MRAADVNRDVAEERSPACWAPLDLVTEGSGSEFPYRLRLARRTASPHVGRSARRKKWLAAP